MTLGIYSNLKRLSAVMYHEKSLLFHTFILSRNTYVPLFDK